MASGLCWVMVSSLNVPYILTYLRAAILALKTPVYFQAITKFWTMPHISLEYLLAFLHQPSSSFQLLMKEAVHVQRKESVFNHQLNHVNWNFLCSFTLSHSLPIVLSLRFSLVFCRLLAYVNCQNYILVVLVSSPPNKAVQCSIVWSIFLEFSSHVSFQPETSPAVLASYHFVSCSDLSHMRT